MKKEMIARAWTDPEYRSRLSAEEQADVPESPVGTYEVDPTMLEAVVGGNHNRRNSGGRICTLSAECRRNHRSCNPFFG